MNRKEKNYERSEIQILIQEVYIEYKAVFKKYRKETTHFSKDGKYIYAVNELVPSISVFAYEKGRATLLNTFEIECKKAKANGAAIRLSMEGKYLYVSLREENVICVFAVDGNNLKLLQKIDCGGDSPRDFDVCGSHLIICNEKSENVSVYFMRNGLVANKATSISIKNALCVVKNI